MVVLLASFIQWDRYSFLAGYIDIVRYMVDGMASIDLLTAEKETPASIAAEHGHFGVVRHLVAHGASVDAKRVRAHPVLLSVSASRVSGLICGVR